MWNAVSPKSWLKKIRLWDSLYAFACGGLLELDRFLREIETFRLRRKPAKMRCYRFTLEQLEARETPSTSTWTGGGTDDYWINADNWDNGVPSTTSDTAVINNSSFNVVIGNAGFSLENLIFSAGTIDGTDGGYLAISGTGSSWSGGTFLSNGGAIVNLLTDSEFEIAGDVTLDEAMIYNVGTVTWTSGNLTIDNAGYFDNAGVLTWLDGDLYLANSGVLYNGGTFDVQTDSTIFGATGGYFSNAGTFQKTAGSGTTDIQADFKNSGTVSEDYGSILFSDGSIGAWNGTFEGVEFDGANFAFGSTGGNSIIFKSVTISSGIIDATEDGLWGASIYFAEGTSTWAGGSVALVDYVSTYIWIQEGATLDINGSSKAMYMTILTNYGTINWTDGDIALSESIIYNYGTFNMSSGLDMTNTGDNSTFVNYGTLVVGGTGGYGTNELDLDFGQQGTGILSVEIEEKSGNKFDRLVIDGTVGLSGTLKVRSLSGLDVAPGDGFHILMSDDLYGAFNTLDIDSFGGNPSALIYESTDAILIIPVTVTFSAPSYTVGEGDGTKTITVTLSAPADYTVTVDYATADGIASSSSDYTAIPEPPATATLTFTPTDTSETFDVTIADDSENEIKEFFYSLLSNLQNATPGAVMTTKVYIIDNDPPDAVDDTEETNEDTPLVLTVEHLLENDADPEILTITSWTQPTHGSIAFAGGKFTYKPNANYNGSDSFTYTVNDGDGGADTATVAITVNPVNDAPVAIDDVGKSGVSIDVLDNDTDPEDDSLTVTGVTNGTYGTVAIDTGDLTVTYTLTTGGYIGPDYFTYTISDGNGGTDTATVTVMVGAGQWATSVIAVSSSYTSGGPYEWYAEQALGEPDTKEYGDQPTAWTPGNGSECDCGCGCGEEEEEEEFDPLQTITVGFDVLDHATAVLIRESGANGFVTLVEIQSESNAWETVFNVENFDVDDTLPGSVGDLFITFTETAYNVKAVRVTVNTEHSDGWEEIDAIRLFGVDPDPNNAPTLNDDPTVKSVNEDESVDIDLVELASDADDDPLFFSVTSDPAHGWVDFSDNDTPDDFDDDYFTYTPEPDFNGSDGFEYTVEDIFGKTVTGTINITIGTLNDDPFVAEAFGIGYKNTPFTIDVADLVEDADGGSPTITENSANATVSGTVITYTPVTDFTGMDQFTFTADGVASATVTVWIYETGQWATSVINVSSQYATGEETDYTAEQMLDEPDTFAYGDSGTAWAAATADNVTSETITVGFTTPDKATGVVIRESNAGGFVTKVEVQEENNTWHEKWTGADPSSSTKLSDFIVRFSQTAYNVKAVRITVSTSLVEGDWEEIDAIRLLTGGSPGGTTADPVELNTAPSAADDRTTTELNEPIIVRALMNDYDPDGDTLTITAKTDGANGDVTITDGGTTVTYEPENDWYGDDSFTYTISDGSGGTKTATVYVTVYPLGEWATSIIAFSSQHANNSGAGTAFQSLGAPNVFTFGDLGAAWSALNQNDGIHTLTVGFGNPDKISGVIIREVSGNGFVTQIDLQDDGDVWYNSVWSGADTSAPGEIVDFLATFTQTIFNVQAVRIHIDTDHDPDAWEAIDAVRLLTDSAATPANAAPTVDDDELETSENLPLIINALGSAADSDGDPLLLSIAAYPQHGTVEVNNAGTPDDLSDDFLIYKPYANYSGDDSFSYTVTDPLGASDTAVIDITVNDINQAPVVGSDLTEIEPNTPVTINVLDNDYDPDDDAMEITSVTQGRNGAVTITGDGTTVTYVPDEDFSGPDFFTYTVSDGDGGTTIARVNVHVTPAGQWASGILAQSAGAGTTDDILGAPDGAAWMPDGENPVDFITVYVADSSQSATGVLIRESSPSVVQVQLIEVGGTYHTIWTGTDPTRGGDFVLNFQATGYNVIGVKIVVQGGASIDAVRLLTGGTASETAVSDCAWDYNGNYVVTTFNGDGQPVMIDAYFQGLRIQTQELAYTEGVLTAVTTTDALGRQTNVTYDEDGRKLTETFAYGTGGASTTTYGYTEGNLTSLLDPKGNETTWVYDGNEVTMTDPFGNSEVKTYNDDGQLISILSRNDRLRTFEYDQQGRLEIETWYNGPTTGAGVVDTLTWAYNAAGQILSAGNDEGNYTFVYNDAGQVIHVDELYGVTLDFAYDEAGNRILVKDSLGGTETSLYGADNLLGSRTLTQGAVTLRIDFTYDQYGRVITQNRYSDAAGTTLVATSTFSYDAQGNITRILHKDDGNVIVSQFDYNYDDAGQLVSETDYQLGIDDDPWNIDYNYDDQGQLTQEQFVGYTLETLDQLEAHYLESFTGFVADSPLDGTTATYNAPGDNGFDWEAVVDGAYLHSIAGALSVAFASDAIVITPTGVDANALGGRFYLTDASGDPLSGIVTIRINDRDDYEFELDSDDFFSIVLDEPFASIHISTSEPDAYVTVDDFVLGDAVTRKFDYDAGGNRDTGNTYFENPDLEHDTNQLEDDGTWEYTYDNEGNTLTKYDGVNNITWTYGYDNANHLLYAREYGIGAILELEVEFHYDVFGNRVAKIVDDDGVGANEMVEMRFAIDGWNPTKPAPIGNENYDVLADLNDDNSLATRYFRGDTVDQLLGRVEKNGETLTPYWHLTDHLGSVRDILEGNGDSADSLRYDAFGNVDDSTETHPEYRGRYAWTGRELDVEIGLQYNRARYYDAGTGRWISQDPMGFNAGDANLYRYAHNKPNRKTDPSGLWEDDLHFWMSYTIANYMGLNKISKKFGNEMKDLAYIMAFSAVYVDYHPDTNPLAGIALDPPPAVLQKFHFPRILPPNGNGKVNAGSDAAHATLWLGNVMNNPVLFGIGLHALQDSYSHDGYESQHVIGVQFATHAPDLPWNNKASAILTAKATIKAYYFYARRHYYDTFFTGPESWVKQANFDKLENKILCEITPLFTKSSWDDDRKNEIRTWGAGQAGDMAITDELLFRNNIWRLFVRDKFNINLNPQYKTGIPAPQQKEFLRAANLALLPTTISPGYMKSLKDGNLSILP